MCHLAQGSTVRFLGLILCQRPHEPGAIADRNTLRLIHDPVGALDDYLVPIPLAVFLIAQHKHLNSLQLGDVCLDSVDDSAPKIDHDQALVLGSRCGSPLGQSCAAIRAEREIVVGRIGIGSLVNVNRPASSIEAAACVGVAPPDEVGPGLAAGWSIAACHWSLPRSQLAMICSCVSPSPSFRDPA